MFLDVVVKNNIEKKFLVKKIIANICVKKNKQKKTKLKHRSFSKKTNSRLNFNVSGIPLNKRTPSTRNKPKFG